MEITTWTKLFVAFIVAAPQGQMIPAEQFKRELFQRQVVYIGEQHDQSTHHAVQREVLAEIEGGGVTVGLEMLDVTQQPALDAWLAGRTSDTDFAAFWKKAWGFPFELYRPILQLAKDHSLPVRALNAPIAVVRQVAKGGLASLTPSQRALLPAVIRPIKDPRYLAYVKRSLGGHGPMPPEVEARMLEAMSVWNETMGQSVVDAAQDGRRVVVIAGMGHMLYGAGIAESVRSRAPLSQTVVLPYPLDDSKQPLADLLKALSAPAGDIQLADYFRLNPASTEGLHQLRSPHALQRQLLLDLSRLR